MNFVYLNLDEPWLLFRVNKIKESLAYQSTYETAMTFRYLLHCQTTKAQVSLRRVQTHQSLCCLHSHCKNVDEDSDQNLDL